MNESYRLMFIYQRTNLLFLCLSIKDSFRFNLFFKKKKIYTKRLLEANAKRISIISFFLVRIRYYGLLEYDDILAS